MATKSATKGNTKNTTAKAANKGQSAKGTAEPKKSRAESIRQRDFLRGVFRAHKEGMSNEEAAKLIGMPKNLFSTRLSNERKHVEKMRDKGTISPEDAEKLLSRMKLGRATREDRVTSVDEYNELLAEVGDEELEVA